MTDRDLQLVVLKFDATLKVLLKNINFFKNELIQKTFESDFPLLYFGITEEFLRHLELRFKDFENLMFYEQQFKNPSGEINLPVFNNIVISENQMDFSFLKNEYLQSIKERKDLLEKINFLSSNLKSLNLENLKLRELLKLKVG